MSDEAVFSPPSGDQHAIRRGSHRVVVTEVGATLRHYSVDDVDVIDGFGPDETSTAGRGQVLAPWPNRLDGGRYSYEGRDAAAALDEPERNNAIHGLVRWLPWQARGRQDHAIELGCVLHPQPAYPWRLDLRVEYRLEDGGLTVITRAVNLSPEPAPFGVGFHPYLTVGSSVDQMHLSVPAERRLLSDERGLPMGDAPVKDTEFDFTAGRTVGRSILDTAYGDLVRGDDDTVRTQVVGHDGNRRITLWADSSFRYIMVYTGDTIEPRSRRRSAIAIEPMTCPPNAFRSGADVLRIDPWFQWTARWGIVPRPTAGRSQT